MAKAIPITFLQHRAITLATWDRGKKLYDKDKSEIIMEFGGETTAKDGEKFWVGSFIAKLWHRGTYRFDCKLETWGNGKQVYSVEHKKVK